MGKILAKSSEVYPKRQKEIYITLAIHRFMAKRIVVHTEHEKCLP